MYTISHLSVLLQQNDTILVDLDGGTISVPDSASLLHFPDWISLPVTKALKQVSMHLYVDTVCK